MNPVRNWSDQVPTEFRHTRFGFRISPPVSINHQPKTINPPSVAAGRRRG
jgi:hypothetical protein